MHPTQEHPKKGESWRTSRKIQTAIHLSQGILTPHCQKWNSSSKQSINKDSMALSNVLDQMDLSYIYRTFHPKEAKCTFFSSVHGTFSKTDHMIGHKASLNKFKKIEIVSSIFSDHKGLKLETNPKGKNPKHSKSWRLNSMLLTMNGSRTRLGKKSKTFWKQMKMNSQQPKSYGTQQRQS